MNWDNYITGNLILVKEIIKYGQEQHLEAYMIMMDFFKAYDRIDRTSMIATLEAMNVSEQLIALIILLYRIHPQSSSYTTRKANDSIQKAAKTGLPTKPISIQHSP